MIWRTNIHCREVYLLLEIVFHALITSQLDYCSSLDVGLAQARLLALDKLHQVQNAADRFLTGTWKRDLILFVLASLHWN